MDTATLFGAAATLCSTTSFVPQAWKVIRTRDADAISGSMYAVTVAGFALWLGYGIALGQWPLMITNGVCLVLAGFILTMKLLPRLARDRVAGAFAPAAAPNCPPAARDL